jgi:hypothetical protein
MISPTAKASEPLRKELDEETPRAAALVFAYAAAGIESNVLSCRLLKMPSKPSILAADLPISAGPTMPQPLMSTTKLSRRRTTFI